MFPAHLHLTKTDMFDRQLYKKLRSKVRIDEHGCWIWTGSAFLKRKYAAHRYGHTAMKINGIWRTRTTHRAMWYALYGWPKKPLCVCHKCDVPLCCNPKHLFLGTHRDNMQDSKQKGRHFLSAKTLCMRGHLLSGDNLFVDKNNCRHCKACELIRTRLKAGWPEHLALTLPPQTCGVRPAGVPRTNYRRGQQATG